MQRKLQRQSEILTNVSSYLNLPFKHCHQVCPHTEGERQPQSLVLMHSVVMPAERLSSFLLVHPSFSLKCHLVDTTLY